MLMNTRRSHHHRPRSRRLRQVIVAATALLAVIGVATPALAAIPDAGPGTKYHYVEGAPYEAEEVQIADNPGGDPVIFYKDNSGILNAAPCPNQSCTDTLPTNALWPVEDFSVVLRDGLPVVAHSYDGYPSDTVRVTFCHTVDCSQYTHSPILSTHVPTWAGISLDLDAQGRASIVFGRGDLEFVSCKSEYCFSFTKTTLVSPHQDFWPSHAVGNDGLARIAYHDSYDNELEYLRCLNVDCTSRVRRALDSSGHTGLTPSLAIDETTGQTAIAWNAPHRPGLMFGRCENLSCSVFTPTLVTDELGPSHAAGYNPTLRMHNGRASIAHYDFLTGDSLFVHCGDPNCSNVVPQTHVRIGSRQIGYDYPGLALTTSGRPIAISSSDLRVAKGADLTLTK